MKIKASVFWHMESEEDVLFVKEFLEGYRKNVQLAFTGREDIERSFSLIDAPAGCVSSIFLPMGLTLVDFKEKNGLIEKLRDLFGVNLFVISPFVTEDIDIIVDYVVTQKEEYCLCLETSFSAGGGIASPFNLLANYGWKLTSPYCGLCINFSCIDTNLATSTFIESLLPYTKMFQVSSRIGKAKYAPLFKKASEINAFHLLASVMGIEKLGLREVVLRYHKQYEKELIKHIFYLDSYIISKRKRWLKGEGA